VNWNDHKLKGKSCYGRLFGPEKNTITGREQVHNYAAGSILRPATPSVQISRFKWNRNKIGRDKDYIYIIYIYITPLLTRSNMYVYIYIHTYIFWFLKCMEKAYSLVGDGIKMQTNYVNNFRLRLDLSCSVQLSVREMWLDGRGTQTWGVQ
jgi:hypothetical protein